MPLYARPAPVQKPKKRPRIIPLFLLLVFSAYLLWSLVAIPHSSYQGKAEALTAADTGTVSSLAWPGYGQAAVGTLNAGLLANNGPQTSVPIASVAKVMLALSVLREKPFAAGDQGETLTLSQSDVDIYNHYVSVDGSVALVAAGEQITEYQALQALLLPSANNMAASLAIWTFGSVDSYTDYANNYANQLGLTHTHLADASGFDPGTVSSAVDLIKLGQLAMKDPIISDIASQRTAVIPVAGRIRNVNWLLGSGNGFIGLKTGNTDQAGGCILFAAQHKVGDQELTIIGVILGAPNLSTSLHDAIPLLTSVKTNFKDTLVVRQGQTVGSYTTPWGGQVNVSAARDLHTIVWKGGSVKPEVIITPVQLPAKQGQTVGKVIATTATGVSGDSVPVQLSGDLKNPSWWWRVTHPAQLLHA